MNSNVSIKSINFSIIFIKSQRRMFENLLFFVTSIYCNHQYSCIRRFILKYFMKLNYFCSQIGLNLGLFSCFVCVDINLTVFGNKDKSNCELVVLEIPNSSHSNLHKSLRSHINIHCFNIENLCLSDLCSLHKIKRVFVPKMTCISLIIAPRRLKCQNKLQKNSNILAGQINN